MKKRITQDDYVKANRKASREAEIEMYGHPICHKRVHQSKKVYNRRKIKAADKKLPYFFVFKIASLSFSCLLYTSDAADALLCVDLGGRAIHKKKKNI